LIDRGTEVKGRVQIWRGGTHVESANRGLRNRRDLNAHSRRPGSCRHRIRDLSLLLSDRRCDLLAGYPLVKDGLGKPGAETGRMPGFAGSMPADRRRRVTLGTLTPTRPYHFAGLAVVLDGKAVDKPIAKLGRILLLPRGSGQR
jgi:hypothetical protein